MTKHPLTKWVLSDLLWRGACPHISVKHLSWINICQNNERRPVCLSILPASFRKCLTPAQASPSPSPLAGWRCTCTWRWWLPCSPSRPPGSCASIGTTRSWRRPALWTTRWPGCPSSPSALYRPMPKTWRCRRSCSSRPSAPGRTGRTRKLVLRGRGDGDCVVVATVTKYEAAPRGIAWAVPLLILLLQLVLASWLQVLSLMVFPSSQNFRRFRRFYSNFSEFRYYQQKLSASRKVGSPQCILSERRSLWVFRFQKEHLLLRIFSFPLLDGNLASADLNMAENFHPTSYNMVAGQCFTYQERKSLLRWCKSETCNKQFPERGFPAALSDHLRHPHLRHAGWDASRQGDLPRRLYPQRGNVHSLHRDVAGVGRAGTDEKPLKFISHWKVYNSKKLFLHLFQEVFYVQ